MIAAYFDCFSGISGDMALGALISAGADIILIKSELEKLNLKEYKIFSESITKSGILSVNLFVETQETHHHRKFSDIRELILTSNLNQNVKDLSIRIFTKLAEAEAKVHGTTPDSVHFHEVGAIDSIVDIVGTAIAFDILKIEKIYCSLLKLGRGFAKTSHGLMPLPAPATIELLKGYKTKIIDMEGEFVTPTGAAIVTALTDKFGESPDMKVIFIGYGSGKKEFGETPNLLRVVIGEVESGLFEQPVNVTVLETNIDDMNPQLFSDVMEKLFEAGALDVYMSPIYMKKNRPATLLSVISPDNRAMDLARIIVEQTSSFGVRMSSMKRLCSQREFRKALTPYGEVNIKIARLDNRIVTKSPEYSDVRAIADSLGIPVKLVYDAAITAADSIKT